MGKTRVEPAKNVTLDQVLKALGDTRLSIVKQLLSEQNRERACGTFDHNLTKATFSHHMNILVEAGILQIRKEGTRSMTSLKEIELNKKFPGLISLLLNK